MNLIMITGGAGFIGSNLIHHVIDRPEVAKLVNLDCLTYAGRLENLETVSKHPKYVFEKVDLRDKAATLQVVEQHAITHVMHLAAESHVDRSITGPGDFIHDEHSRHVQSAGSLPWMLVSRRVRTIQINFITSRPMKFMVRSARPDFSPRPRLTRRTRRIPPARRRRDFLVRAYHHTYGLPTVITNCSNNYGPFQFPEKLIPVVIQSVLARKTVPVYGDGMNVRDWLYVRDHAEALWTVLQQGQARRDLQHRRPQRMGEHPHRAS